MGSQLYLQLLYYQHLFEVQKALDKTSGDEKEALSRGLKAETEAGSVLQKYAAVKNCIDKVMKDNKFSVVSLNKVFQGLHCVKASRFRTNHHNNAADNAN